MSTGPRLTYSVLRPWIFSYPSGYGQFTISFTVKRSYGEEITFTLGPAIPLTDLDCPKSEPTRNPFTYEHPFLDVAHTFLLKEIVQSKMEELSFLCE
ncbi:hypothetical protein KSP39_PZI012603 [Platanthera zijinensis]|uniref:Uncharacterized protein n=1 Tax=Platanthera zijinensis TaxID=2320716 RepID=A0AAP0BFM4_9ASPA